MPAGTATTARAPSTTEICAGRFSRLLLDVRTANGCGRDRAADDAGDRDQGEDVRKRLEQGSRASRIRREPLRERAREAEEERGGEGAARPPAAEDQRRERDEAAAGGHVLVERVDEADREVGAAQRGEDPGEDDGGVADAVDRD